MTMEKRIAKERERSYYRFGLAERRRYLADTGFTRDEYQIWRHADGRALGEGVASALTDAAFFRYLGVGVPRSSSKGRRRRG
jgi:hypothetical protein